MLAISWTLMKTGEMFQEEYLLNNEVRRNGGRLCWGATCRGIAE